MLPAEIVLQALLLENRKSSREQFNAYLKRLTANNEFSVASQGSKSARQKACRHSATRDNGVSPGLAGTGQMRESCYQKCSNRCMKFSKRQSEFTSSRPARFSRDGIPLHARTLPPVPAWGDQREQFQQPHDQVVTPAAPLPTTTSLILSLHQSSLTKNRREPPEGVSRMLTNKCPASRLRHSRRCRLRDGIAYKQFA